MLVLLGRSLNLSNAEIWFKMLIKADQATSEAQKALKDKACFTV